MDGSGALAVAGAVANDLRRRAAVVIEVTDAEIVEGGLDNLLVRAHLAGYPNDWPDDVVIRVLPGDDRAADAAREVAMHERCVAAGLPVPRIVADGIVDDGPYVVMPFVDAPQALDLLTKPWLARRVGRILGDLHVKVHEAAIDRSGMTVKSVDFWIATLSDALDDAPKEWRAQVAWLDAHRDRAGVRPATLCHFDFHIMNVLIASDGAPTVLDWDLAALGDPVADSAFALEILELMPSALASRAARAMAGITLRQVARGYLRAVRPHMDLPPRDLTYWRALYCTVASGFALGLPIAGVRAKEGVVDVLSAPVLATATARFARHTRT